MVRYMPETLEYSECTVLDSLGYAYFEADLSGVLTNVNEAFCEGVNTARDEIIGSHYSLFTDPDHIQRIKELFQLVYRSGQPQKNIEYNFIKRGGSLSYAEGSVALLRDAAGQPSGFRGVLHDITEHKLAEEAIQQAKEAAERELEIGRRIQATFLPQVLPQPPGWEIAARIEAAREVAGDFYDAFSLSDGKRTGLVIADVCDKGVGAALFMALFRSLVRAFADQHYSLGWMDLLSNDLSTAGQTNPVTRRRELLSTGATALKKAIELTNNYIANNHGQANIFATLFFGILDPATGSLMYINGGHEPPALIGGGRLKTRLEPTGPAVGLLPNLDFTIEQVKMEPGDILVAFTDGVIDSRNPQGESFTENRLLEILERPFKSATGLLEAVHSELDKHMAGASQYDDITMLAVRHDYSTKAGRAGKQDSSSNQTFAR